MTTPPDPPPAPRPAAAPQATSPQVAAGRAATEQARTERAREKEKTGRLKAVLDTIPLLATLTTVSVALFSSLQSQQQYRDTQASARFQSAVELLAGDDLTTRVGGVALLGQVAQTNSERRENAVRLLATFLRVHSPATDAGRAAAVTREPAAEEVRAVFSAMAYRGDVKEVDLGRISARGLQLADADLRGLILARSDLSGGSFGRGDLRGVSLQGATLRGVGFGQADLRGAVLTGADLRDADLRGARLAGTDLRGTTGLTSAQLAGATTDGTTRLPAGITVPVAGAQTAPTP
ncbi:pentapeptide repeat-containing protein [Deinococcus gobiensis]|uniref:OxrA-related protein n=1 Tax=Deinococcus gobiensis (strain DSM 21396 / JCM 16679 / CGMCC 1.7299 / I-0) TaxID=745776 RepID=H8GWH3_DEIGI|nr:pentapeptide repeat-containing protein [Deinococcus gobiensis]AFD26876.1 OxrA-related protein [Deinococcus gobiensis I-0]